MEKSGSVADAINLYFDVNIYPINSIDLLGEYNQPI